MENSEYPFAFPWLSETTSFRMCKRNVSIVGEVLSVEGYSLVVTSVFVLVNVSDFVDNKIDKEILTKRRFYRFPNKNKKKQKFNMYPTRLQIYYGNGGKLIYPFYSVSVYLHEQYKDVMMLWVSTQIIYFIRYFFFFFSLLALTHTHFSHLKSSRSEWGSSSSRIWKTQTIHSNTLGSFTQTFFGFNLFFLT